MREIRTSGSMSGDGKRSVAAWPKLPRPSSTLPKRHKANAADVRTWWYKRTCERQRGSRVMNPYRTSDDPCGGSNSCNLKRGQRLVAIQNILGLAQ
jgi:hypothetical protein